MWICTISHSHCLPHDLVSGLKGTAEEATFVKSTGTLYRASPAKQHIKRGAKKKKKIYKLMCVEAACGYLCNLF